MKLYRVDVKIYATAYVRADNAKIAREIARDEFNNEEITLDGPQVSAEPFDSEELPDVSLSPAATIGGTIGRATRAD